MADNFWSQFDSVDDSSKSKSVEHEHLEKMKNKKLGKLMVQNQQFNSPLSKNPNLQQVSENPLVKYGGATGIGIGQGAINNATSILNTPSDVINMMGGNVPRVPTLNISQYSPPDPYSQAFEKIGEVGGEIGSGLGSYKIAGKVLGLGAEAPVYQRALQGGTTGFAEGGRSGEESPYNIPSDRALGAIAGGGLASLGQLSNRSLADRLSAMRKREKDTASAGYNSLFEKAKERGISDKKMNLPSVDIEEISKNLSSKYRPSLQKYISNPTLDNAHKVQSDIGKMINDIYTKKGGLTSTQMDSYQKFQDFQKRIRGSMVTNLVRNDSEDLANQYSELTKNYAENVSPYNIESLKKYSVNRKRPGSVMNEVYSKSNEPFMLAKGDAIPAVAAGEYLNKLNPIIKHLLGYAAMGGAFNLTKGNNNG